MLKIQLPPAKLLIVDDEPMNVRLLERMLDLYGGVEHRGTTDSRLAAGMFAEFKPDLVLTDLHMPHIDGYTLIEQIRSLVPDDSFLPIVVLTADVTAETRRRALAAGASDFITKPLDTTEVQLRIRNLLENRFLNMRLEEQVRERTIELENALDRLRTAQESVVKQERLRALGMMAGGIAHDFNNALTMMLGYGELLLPWFEKVADGSREQGFLKHIVSAAQDATHVVSRLRDFQRPTEAGDVRKPVDLAALCSHAAELTAPKWKRGGSRGGAITMQTHAAPVPNVLGSAAELREVLTNLIFNAVDAMPDGGAITIRTRDLGRAVRVDVCDTGCGMTEEERARCLEPFFTTKGEQGTGLGLAVAYGIIQRHEGRIEIESEPGRGSTFSLLLPSTDAVAEAPREASAGVVGAPLRVLVVDDQEIICELISEYLRNDGHAVTVAFDAEEALRQFEPGRFDLVITDQSMPGMSGMQLAPRLREISARPPVILLTGFGDEMAASGVLPAGIDLIMAKPVSAAVLRRGIAAVVK